MAQDPSASCSSDRLGLCDSALLARSCPILIAMVQWRLAPRATVPSLPRGRREGLVLSSSSGLQFGRSSRALNGPVQRVTTNTGQSGTTFGGTPDETASNLEELKELAEYPPTFLDSASKSPDRGFRSRMDHGRREVFPSSWRNQSINSSSV